MLIKVIIFVGFCALRDKMRNLWTITICFGVCLLLCDEIRVEFSIGTEIICCCCYRYVSVSHMNVVVCEEGERETKRDFLTHLSCGAAWVVERVCGTRRRPSTSYFPFIIHCVNGGVCSKWDFLLFYLCDCDEPITVIYLFDEQITRQWHHLGNKSGMQKSHRLFSPIKITNSHISEINN